MTFDQSAQEAHDESLERQMRVRSAPVPQQPQLLNEEPETEEGSERLEQLRRYRTRLSSQARPAQTQESLQQQSDMQPPSAST
jgi:hypothetical protein